jgi:hypothetical protein
MKASFVDFTGFTNQQIIDLMLPMQLAKSGYVIALRHDEDIIKIAKDHSLEMMFVYDLSSVNIHYTLIFKFTGYSTFSGRLKDGVINLKVRCVQRTDSDILSLDTQKSFERSYASMLLIRASPVKLSEMLDRYGIRDDIYKSITEMIKETHS